MKTTTANGEQVSTISPAQARDLLTRCGESIALIDVRSPAEFESEHAVSAINLPLHTITIENTNQFFGKRLICICQKGSRGAQAASLLLSFGFNDVSNVEGGTEAWIKSQLEVVCGNRSISIERQVRIAAGTLVVLGTIFGYFFTPYANLIALFVGCGLIFAGVTDTCGMALILARCPWNLRKKP